MQVGLTVQFPIFHFPSPDKTVLWISKQDRPVGLSSVFAFKFVTSMVQIFISILTVNSHVGPVTLYFQKQLAPMQTQDSSLP